MQFPSKPSAIYMRELSEDGKSFKGPIPLIDTEAVDTDMSNYRH